MKKEVSGNKSTRQVEEAKKQNPMKWKTMEPEIGFRPWKEDSAMFRFHVKLSTRGDLEEGFVLFSMELPMCALTHVKI